MFYNILANRVVGVRLFILPFTLSLAFILSLATPALAHGPIHSKSPILGPFECIEGDVDCEKSGHSKIARFHDGIGAKFQTSGLVPGNTYTFWWVVFNKPEHCVDGCGEDDYTNEKAMPSALWAAGKIADPHGKASFKAFLWQGRHNGEVLFGDGLIYPKTAEIQFIARSHGPKIPGLVHDQLYLYLGGCDIQACVDVQFAVHLPPTVEKMDPSH